MFKISYAHAQNGLTYKYDLDTNLFNENIFKMCSECEMFAHDFSQIFCKCGRKLDYVDITDTMYLSYLQRSIIVDDHISISDTLSDADTFDDIVTATDVVITEDGGEFVVKSHNCVNSDDCLDCEENQWDDDDDDDDDDKFDSSDSVS